MIEFEIKDVKYQIPDVISIKNYVDIYKVKDLFSDDYFAAKLLNIVTGVPVEDALEGDYAEINYLATEILLKIPINKPEFIDRFEIDGIKYGFIPDWKDMTFAEFADLDTLSTKKEDEILSNLHIIAAIMFRPITDEVSEHDYQIEKYDVKKMKKRAEIFKNKLDIKYVLGAQFFFIKFARTYSNYFQVSSIQKLSIWKKIKIVWTLRMIIFQTVFKRPTAGSLSSTRLVETILKTIK